MRPKRLATPRAGLVLRAAFSALVAAASVTTATADEPAVASICDTWGLQGKAGGL
jgi:phosphate-selective porin